MKAILIGGESNLTLREVDNSSQLGCTLLVPIAFKLSYETPKIDQRYKHLSCEEYEMRYVCRNGTAIFEYVRTRA